MVEPGAIGSPGSDGPTPAVFFLSDYGTADEFVGVVHAVLHRLAPTVPVIDLSHGVPAFDVEAGAALLVRSGPYLGPGVVLAVVDPGVGTGRRGVALEVPPGGPTWLVGPDNGLLVPLAAMLGGVVRAVVLDPSPAGVRTASRTFDGRDVFAPAVAHLVSGGPVDALGTPVAVASLVVVPAGTTGVPPSLRPGSTASEVVAAVRWIDGFGNAQLDLFPEALRAIGLVPGGTARITLDPTRPAGGLVDPAPADGDRRVLAGRWVEAFGQLGPGELGLLEDADGRVALVLDRASAALALRLVGPGTVVGIEADRGPTPGSQLSA